MQPTIQNDTFDFVRFRHCLKEYLRDRRKELIPYAISTIVLIAIFTIGNVCRQSGGVTVWGLTSLIYFIIMCMCVGVSSRAFINLSTVNGALTELTTPASQLEKFLSRWIVSVLLPLIFCIVMIKGVEIVAIHSLTIFYTEIIPLENAHLESIKMAYSFTATWLIMTVWLQAIFFLGSVGWRKYSQLKTIAILILMSILVVVVCAGYMPWLRVTYCRTATILLITVIPLCLYHASWMIYRRAQVK